MLITTSIVTLTLTLPIPTQDTKIAEDCKGFLVTMKDMNDNTVEVLCTDDSDGDGIEDVEICPIGYEVTGWNGGDHVICSPIQGRLT